MLPENAIHSPLPAAAPSQNGATASDVVPGLLSPVRIAMAARMVFIVLSLLVFAYWARAVVLPVLLACLLAVTLNSPMRGLRRCHLPAPLAALVLVGVLVTGAGLSVAYLGRPAVEWLAAAPENLPRIKARFQNVLGRAAQLSEAASTMGTLATPETSSKSPAIEVKDNRMAGTVFTWTGTFLSGAMETVALLFLLLSAGDLFLIKLVQAMPRLRDKKRAVEISREVQQSLSRYLLSVGCINVAFGFVVGIALHFIGMPNALMWGGVAAFANFVPVIGPVLGMVSTGIAGLLAFDTFGRGIMPVSAYCLLHLVESYAVTPFLLGRRFALNPVLIFVTLIFCTWLWGIIGALLAVPLLVTAKAILDRTPGLRPLGDLLTPDTVAPSTPP